MIKQCKKCGVDFDAGATKATSCPACRVELQTKRTREWAEQKKLKRMAVYENDYAFIKSLYPTLSVYDALQIILERYRKTC